MKAALPHAKVRSPQAIARESPILGSDKATGHNTTNAPAKTLALMLSGNRPASLAYTLGNGSKGGAERVIPKGASTASASPETVSAPHTQATLLSPGVEAHRTIAQKST